MNAVSVEDIILYGSLGAVLAGAYLLALRVNVRLYLEGHRLWQGIALHVGRLALVGGGLVLAALQGAVPLVSAVVGFSLVRFGTMAIVRLRS